MVTLINDLLIYNGFLPVLCGVSSGLGGRFGYLQPEFNVDQRIAELVYPAVKTHSGLRDNTSNTIRAK